MKLNEMQFGNIRNWVYRNSRPLDLALWQYHFENGLSSEVIKFLSAYQNQDGGFAHALEPDCWNKESSPIQTWAATEILYGIKFNENNHPIIQRILQYLNSGKDFVDERWLNTIPSNNLYPHAPWWHYYGYEKNDYNPTASLVGFILKFANKESEIYKKACFIANQLITSFLKDPNLEKHSLKNFSRMMDYIKEAKLQKEFAYDQVITVLKEQILSIIKKDQKNWNSYSARPSDFIEGSQSVYLDELTDIVDQEIDFIIGSLNNNDVWSITWNWGNYESEYCISKNWWQTHLAVKYLKFILINKKRSL